MTEEQRQQLEEDEAEPAAVEFEQAEVDKAVFNKDTNRVILRNLMENGIRDATGTRVGKTIIFARNHNHAVLLQNLFDEMYPQYGGNFCRVIDNYDPRAEELIDDFKGEGKNPDLTIAISVDMLDTGIDVPEIVNLVFAKPVYSYVKFWQMIGRGTRLRREPLRPRPGQDALPDLRPLGELRVLRPARTRPPSPSRPSRSRSVVFEARITLAETALQQANPEAFETAIDLIAKDIADLPGDDHRRPGEVEGGRDRSRTRTCSTSSTRRPRTVLMGEIAPLMQWREHRRQRGGPPVRPARLPAPDRTPQAVEQVRRPQGRAARRSSTACG